jgi:hypothetical protein
MLLHLQLLKRVVLGVKAKRDIIDSKFQTSSKDGAKQQGAFVEVPRVDVDQCSHGDQQDPPRVTAYSESHANPSSTNPATVVGARFVTEPSALFTGGAGSSSVLPNADKIYRCEDEPIHAPGGIQSFGALVALRVDHQDKILVRMASENTRDIIGHSPEELFSLQSFTDLLPHSEKATFRARMASILTVQENADHKTNPDVFAISLTSLNGAPTILWCAMHYSSSKLVVCEFELQEKYIFNRSQ